MKVWTQELCRFELHQDPEMIFDVPERFLTEEMYIIAVKHKHGGEFLEFIPEEMRTEEICRISVGNCPHAILSVPEKMMTVELCRFAIQSNKEAFQYLPEEMKRRCLSQKF